MARRTEAKVLWPWLSLLAVAAALPLVVKIPFYVSTGISAVMFVGLAVCFDLVVGRIGALSLAQPLFFAFGAYIAAILSSRLDTSFWLEAPLVILASAALAIVIGIPSFRLSLHAFAIGTLGFALIGELVAKNWVDVTGGPLCITGIQPLRLSIPGMSIVATTLGQQYWVVLGIVALIISVVIGLLRRNAILAFTAVRDDPVLASARGFSPNQVRIGVFALAAAGTGLVGLFAAHFQTVVCPTSAGFSLTIALLIMVFIGGRASLRGVIIGAVVFTVLPQLLRAAAEWRLFFYGGMLLIFVIVLPKGLEGAINVGANAIRGMWSRTYAEPTDSAVGEAEPTDSAVGEDQK